MKDIDAEDGAKRGNVAILLWNMLRTRMWDITEENQSNGMTYGEKDFMLNTKFPDYEYNDEAEFDEFTVDKDGKVEVTVISGTEVIFGNMRRNVTLTGELKSGDLLRLVPGMKVAYLYNTKDEVFLTLTGVDTLVEGRVDANDKLNGKEYKDENGVNQLNAGDYVVVLVDGKKYVEHVVLPNNGTEIDGTNLTLKRAQKQAEKDAKKREKEELKEQKRREKEELKEQKRREKGRD